MADNKLFYKVGESNAESFKTVKKDESVIGLINPREGSASHFGYFISGGQQYGPSYADIERIAVTKSTKPNGTGSFSADGADYTISFDENGTISVSKYVATVVSSIELGTIEKNITATGGGTFYVGYTYTVNVGIDVTSRDQEVIAKFKNDTKQAFEVEIHDGSHTCYTYSMPAGLANPSVTYYAPSNYIMNDVANQTYTGVVQYNKSYTPSVSTSGLTTFTVKANDGKTIKTLSKTQTVISASATVSSKTIFAYGMSKDFVLPEDNYISKKLYKDGDNTYASSGDYSGSSKPSKVTIAAGTPTVIFHESLGTPTFKQLSAEDEAWSKTEKIEVAGVNDNVDPNNTKKIQAPAYYLIYQHEPTNGENTWDITWK